MKYNQHLSEYKGKKVRLLEMDNLEGIVVGVSLIPEFLVVELQDDEYKGITHVHVDDLLVVKSEELCHGSTNNPVQLPEECNDKDRHTIEDVITHEDVILFKWELENDRKGV